MQVIFHCGAHGTEEDRLLKTLLRNKDRFRLHGTVVPGPGKYRYLLKDCMAALQEGQATTEARDVLWDAILEEEQADRVLLSNANFFGSQRQSIEGSQFYPEAEARLLSLQHLFAQDKLELYIGLRNPATILPGLLENAHPDRKAQVLSNLDPYHLRWSDLLTRLRRAVPQVPLTVWCFEDMPLIWAQIIRDMSGLEMNQRLDGGMDLLSTIMSREGMRRLRQYLAQHPDMSETQQRRVMAAFLDKYVREDELEEEIDLPGWSEALIESVTALYEEDMQIVQRIPGVTMITP
ncbi:hypothetical protein [Pseudophaeobacter sp.]|jgi:hypothetical protein|uniref:hypothetical protein n=1 Tax=unclassified Pseudophaeobacter TaxID=2637024 RepID=UPI0025F50A54|nr:hypothetical protein [uncultured Pseudophaeobacter sp.]